MSNESVIVLVEWCSWLKQISIEEIKVTSCMGLLLN